jgi:hypothetical protein
MKTVFTAFLTIGLSVSVNANDSTASNDKSAATRDSASIYCRAAITDTVNTSTTPSPSPTAGEEKKAPLRVEEIEEISYKKPKNPGKEDHVASKLSSDAALEAINAGEGMANVGIGLHFIGLGLSIISSIASNTTKQDLTGINIGVAVITIFGPILACAGASKAESGANNNGFHVTETDVWGEYGKGWAMQGAGAGVIFGGVLMGTSSGSQPILLICLLGGAALSIVGEVVWIKSMFHSKNYISYCREFVGNRSMSVVPVIDCRGRYGAALQMGLQ